MSFIKEAWVHDSVAYLRDESNAAAVAKGAAVRAEYHRRAVRGKLVLAAPHATQHLREAWAESHDEYIEVCEKLASCEQEVEKHRNSRNRAEAIIDMWRTEQASMRGLGRVA